MSTTTTSTRERALKLLGNGVNPEAVAAAIGVTVSAISQLISDPTFSAAVAEARFTNLSRANDIDSRYDEMEAGLQKKLSDLLPLMYKPGEVLAAIRIINAAKRRGAASQSELPQSQTIVNITLPTQIVNQFTVNSANQVVRVGTQDLTTIHSSQVEKLLVSRGTNDVQTSNSPRSLEHSKNA